MFYQLLW